MQSVYDVVILGAGINGVAIAREFSEEGSSVCVIEKTTLQQGNLRTLLGLYTGDCAVLSTFSFLWLKKRYIIKKIFFILILTW